MFNPKCYHEFSLKILTSYLNQTKDCGLALNPDSDVYKVDVYPDADFSGIYVHEKPTDLARVKSRT